MRFKISEGRKQVLKKAWSEDFPGGPMAEPAALEQLRLRASASPCRALDAAAATAPVKWARFR